MKFPHQWRPSGETTRLYNSRYVRVRKLRSLCLNLKERLFEGKSLSQVVTDMGFWLCFIDLLTSSLETRD